VQKAVQRLMEFSRPATSSLESLSVNETIEHACELVEVYLATRGVTIELSLAPGLPRVYGNARQLEDLWVNLLLMARDRITRQAAEDGQPHHIRLASSLTPESQVCVRVNDDGELIEPTRLNTIFEPDFVAALGGRGTGLELSICREIVRQHRGQVAAESAPGAGNIFTIFLPPEISL
jgi:signal transduction histidine kinase